MSSLFVTLGLFVQCQNIETSYRTLYAKMMHKPAPWLSGVR